MLNGIHLNTMAIIQLLNSFRFLVNIPYKFMLMIENGIAKSRSSIILFGSNPLFRIMGFVCVCVCQTLMEHSLLWYKVFVDICEECKHPHGMRLSLFSRFHLLLLLLLAVLRGTTSRD